MSYKKFRPIGRRVLAKRIVEENKTESGLYLSAIEQERPTDKIEILCVGDDVDEVKQGEICIFNKSGVALEFEKEQFVLVRVDDIYGILDN